MRYTFVIYCLLLFCSCDSGSFDSDKRQIMAKDVLRSSLPPKSHAFDVLNFKEDTLTASTDNPDRSIRYMLDYVYTDSSGVLQKRTGIVLFTPDGHSVISANTPNP